MSVIGGGTGSFGILSGLGTYEDVWIESIVTVMDSDGDSGRLRDEFGALYNLGVKVVKFGDVISATSLVRHDPARTASVLIELFEELDPLGNKKSQQSS